MKVAAKILRQDLLETLLASGNGFIYCAEGVVTSHYMLLVRLQKLNQVKDAVVQRQANNDRDLVVLQAH